MSIAALFIIAKTRKQPMCPQIDEWMKKVLCIYAYTHTHSGILLSHKKNKQCHLQQHDQTREYHTAKRRKSERKTNIM